MGLLHVIFRTFVPELWPFVSAQYLYNKLIDFHLYFIYAFRLIISSLGLLHVILRTYVPELWPLIYAKISYPLNILRTNRRIFNKFYICIDIDKI